MVRSYAYRSNRFLAYVVGGDGGGRIIAKGSPEEVVKVEGSYTGYYLKPIFKMEN